MFFHYIFRPTGETFWVGKKTMRQIKQLATKEFMNTNDITACSRSSSVLQNSASEEALEQPATPHNSISDVGDKNNNENNENLFTSSSSITPTSASTYNSKSIMSANKHLNCFNQDILCPEHGTFNKETKWFIKKVLQRFRAFVKIRHFDKQEIKNHSPTAFSNNFHNK